MQILVKDGKGERIAPQVLCEYLMLALLEQCGEQIPKDHVGRVHCSFLNGLQSLVDWKSGAHIE